MKKFVIGIWVAVGLLAAFNLGLSQAVSKLWVNVEWTNHTHTLLFVEDRETHTRCYAIVANFADGGTAISCVTAVK